VTSESQLLSIPDALKLGMKHHQSGNLEKAEFIYKKVLDAEPGNAEALHLLGLIYFQARNHERALGLIQRAIAINASVPSFYSNLGLIFQELCHPDIAIRNFQKAIALNPNYAEAHNNLGTALYSIRRYDDALASYQRATAIRSDYAEAHYNIGIVLKALGRPDDAIASYRKALQIRPNYPEAENNMGFIYQEQEKNDDAFEHYQKALSLRPDYVEAHNNIGAVYLAQGKPEEAIESYRRALALNPRYAEAYNNLGYALADQRKFDEAVENYHKALALKPDYADAHNNLGLSLKELGKLDEAIACFDRAIQLQPDFSKAFTNKGIVFQQMGRFDDAMDAYVKSITLKQNYAPAYRNLVQCRKMTEADLPMLTLLEGHLLNAKMSKEDESDVHFALGKIYDDLGQPEKAFAHYKLANDYEHTCYTFDSAQHGAMIQATIDTFTPEFFEQRRDWGCGSDLPILILGMMRSGTTLVEQILSSHPFVFGAGELDFWSEQGKKYPAESMQELTKEGVSSLSDDYIAYLRKFSSDAKHITDKMPNNYLKIGLIHLAFPKARIIHCRRHPVDICLSIYFHKFGGYHPYAYDLDELVSYYQHYDRLMGHWKSILPPDVFFEVQYEELISDQEGVSRKIIEFCGLDWDEQCLHFYDNARPVKTASCWQVRQPLYTSSAERWRNYEQFIGPLSRLLTT